MLTSTLEFALRFFGLNVNLHIVPNEILPTVAEKIEIKEKIEE
jgi:hypothetical protein